MGKKIKNINPNTKTINCIRFSEHLHFYYTVGSWVGRIIHLGNRLRAASPDFSVVTTCVYKRCKCSSTLIWM